MRSHFTQANMFLPLEKPLKELMELNAKTIQSFTYINPTELMSTRKPEELLEKNVDVMINNGHKALDYIHDVFSLMEKNWLNISGTIMDRTKETMSRTETVARGTMDDMARKSKTTVKKMASAVKRSSSRKKPTTKMSASKASSSRSASSAKKTEASKSPVMHSTAHSIPTKQ